MKRFRITAFWQAILVVVAAYLILAYAFPPLLPRALMIQFMVITIIGALLYFSYDDDRWQEFKAPVLAVMRSKQLWPLRWSFLLALPVVTGFAVYDSVRPSFEAPVELRQVHPAPPSTLRVYGTNHDLTSLENPVRNQVLAKLSAAPEEARAVYSEAVNAGREVYFANCFFCHGDLLDGHGPFAAGFSPRPANFQDVGTIAQLQEAFLFWRITTGGPGLPKEGAPWNSAMPVWHEILSEEEIWNVITFLYDYVGQVPRMWNQQVSRAVTAMKDEVQAQRRGLEPDALYQLRCAVCHGETGAGDGPAAEFMYPKPRDFTLGLFKYKTSPGTTMPRDEDLFRTIKHGLEGTGMPGWSKLLTDDQISSLIPVIKRFDIALAWAPEDAPDDAFDEDGRYLRDDFRVVTAVEPSEGQVPYTPESVARGRDVFEQACTECHGDRARGNITSGKRLEDDWGNRIWPRDLTKPWTWRVTNVTGTGADSRDRTIRNIYRRLSIGIPGTPMPAHRAETEGDEDPLTLEERWHVSNYVYSLRENAPPPPRGATITARELGGALPAAVDDVAWQQVPAVTLRLVPNIIKDERLFTPMTDTITVRVAYNDANIAFLLEIDDRTDSRPGEAVSTQIQDDAFTLYPDAFAVQFPKKDAYKTAPIVEKPLYRHGDAKRHTTIWYWNAGSVEPRIAPKTVVMDGTGVDQPLRPRPDVGGVTATGEWRDGRWRVLMTRPREVVDAADIAFPEGQYIPVSFANWDGSNGEVGAKHTLTSWFWLLLPTAVDPVRVYGLPAGSGLLAFILGFWVVRRQRKQASAAE